MFEAFPVHREVHHIMWGITIVFVILDISLAWPLLEVYL